MIPKQHLENIIVSEFAPRELSLLKLLVLENLSKYDDVNVTEESGSIYELLTQIKSKIHYLQSELRGEFSTESNTNCG
mgnify:CR=1 FL=1